MERSGINIKNAIKIENYEKKYENFSLGPLNIEIPSGFVTAIIGENGAGKSTFFYSNKKYSSFQNKLDNCDCFCSFKFSFNVHFKQTLD